MPSFETLFNANTTSFFICALILVVIVAVWLIIKQNSKVIEESMRPYLSLTFSADGNSAGRFIIRNYGKTSAVITRFQYPDAVKKSSLAESFQKVRRTSIAPGQVVSLPCNPTEIKDEDLAFKVVYHSEAAEKNYSETFSFKTAMLNHMSITETE